MKITADHNERDDSNLTLLMSSLEVDNDKEETHDMNRRDIDSSTTMNTFINKFTTNWEASVSLAKAIMGAGSFALPWAFSKMGYIAGPVFMTLLLRMSIYSIQLLVECSQQHRQNQLLLQQRQQQPQQQHQLHNKHGTPTLNSYIRSTPSSYVNIARSTFGRQGACWAYIFSMSASIGVCGSYLVFIAANLESLLWSTETATATANHSSHRQTILIWTIILPIAVILSSIRNMKQFAFASFLGDLSVVLGMIVVVIYGFYHNRKEEPGYGIDSETTSSTTNATSMATYLANENDHRIAIGSISDMALAFGSIGYLFLVHFLVIPIESNMIQPKQFQANVVPQTFSFCAIISGIFGIIGYMLFGNHTEQIVLLNVKQQQSTALLVSAVQFLLCVDLILTYPVVMRPSIVILEETISFHSKQQIKQKNICNKTLPNNYDKQNNDGSNLDDNLLDDRLDTRDPSVATNVTTMVNYKTHVFVCIILGIIAGIVSTIVPAFGLLSGLVGGVSQTFLAFVFPPLMWTKLRQQRNQKHEEDKPQHYTATSATSNQQSTQLFDLDKKRCTSRDIDLIVTQLTWKEKSLVLTGLLLITWTLHTAWIELRQ